ncbi:hypothetical protein B0H14DRAFT_2619008 [Mycena olivaceomarginata]|nr:hypothetical protein B0H14DRAFT_2619008 [Mycena olivaceomarginata]
MDAEALQRENNTAWNHYMLDGLGLGAPQKETQWEGAVAPTKRKAGKQGKRCKSGTKKARSSGDAIDKISEEDDKDSGSEDEPGEKKAPARAKAPPAAKAKQGRQAPAQTSLPGDIKPWAKTAQEFLTKIECGGGREALLSVWWVREKKAGFEGTKQGHPAKKRPKEVKDWVSRARNHTPVIDDAESLGKSWWAWWIDINPGWRRQTRPLLRGTGPLESLDLYGQKGFLNVLMVLKWWRDTMSIASPDWEQGIAEVTWVLQQLHKLRF